jgi:hypothetical protein
MIYFKVSTVSLDPHGKVSDPYIYRPSLQVRSKTPTGTNWTPLCEVRATHDRVPGFPDREYLGLNQRPGEGPKTTCVRTFSYTLLLPAQAETRCCRVAYYT